MDPVLSAAIVSCLFIIFPLTLVGWIGSRERIFTATFTCKTWSKAKCERIKVNATRVIFWCVFESKKPYTKCKEDWNFACLFNALEQLMYFIWKCLGGFME